MTAIKIENVSKFFGSSAAVDNASFTVNSGEIFAILGPSGCGKTTTLRLIAGFESPDKGAIYIEDRKVAGQGVFVEAEKRSVGLVFQDYALFPHMRVWENIAFGLQNVAAKDRGGVVDTMLSFVGLSGYRDRYPFELSGGQQQRVALARALAPSPVVVLLDEPLSNLDADMRVRMREEMLGVLKKAGTTTIIVTHDQEEAFSMADHVAVFNGGMVEQIGTPEEIYHSPRTRFVAEFVGEADFLEGCVVEGGVETEIGFFKSDVVSLGDGVVQVMIRPDDISFVPDEGCDSVVVQRQFKGEENLYHIRLPSGVVLHSSQPSTFIVEVGAFVRVVASPAHLILFDGDLALEK